MYIRRLFDWIRMLFAGIRKFFEKYFNAFFPIFRFRSSESR
jgi:hypothetical protein